MDSIKHFSLLFFIFITVFSCNTSINNSKTIQNNSQSIEMKKEQVINLLVGTYTGEASKGIYQFKFNPNTGELNQKNLVAESENPSFLTISQDRNLVLAVNETDSGTISSFKWDEGRTKLNLIDQRPSAGMHPCHIVINPSQNLVAAANYSSGNSIVYPINAEGKIFDKAQMKQHEGSGPVKPNQDAPRAHFAAFSATGTYLYIVDLGIDKVMSYPVNSSGELGDPQVALQLDKGDGPRHLVFHPDKDLVYIVNELSNTVVVAQVDKITGLFKRLDKKSTLPDGFSGKSFCADIHISQDGKFLYASNRGHNSIAIFKVLENGHLELLGTEGVQGEWPRNFAISPNGKHVLVANQNTNNITVFDVNSKTGLLHYTGKQVELDRPVCLKF